MKKNVGKKIFYIILLGCLYFPVFADVYRYVDSDGVVTYSDQPQIHSEIVTLSPANISTQNNTNQTNHDSSKLITTKTEAYKTFEIIHPKNQTTFQNEINIPVILSISPELSHDDTVQLLLDGKAIFKPQNTLEYVLPKVFNNQLVLTRGSHTLQANLLDKNDKIIMQTKLITVFIHYTSTLNPVVGP
ncbi:MAG: hypothetical protein ACD_46C00109G0002 [uncultured bacterium]|nr:MAG: hypothetical protein ACD_46C00109G0002 [uncultured bacterium]